MEITTLQKNEEEKQPIVVMDSVKLKVGDGIRLGFGFGLGMFIWVALFSVVAFFGAGVIVKMLASSIKLF